MPPLHALVRLLLRCLVLLYRIGLLMFLLHLQVPILSLLLLIVG